MKPILFVIILFFIGWSTPAYAIISIVSVHNCSSASVCDGQVTVAASGSGAPFTFLWNNWP
ncbi:MAG: SprB repeat-containing protein [Bacteroidetes bacterium]|nr:SprB repeat-containing protein [Bacteroidota bacterium]